jgi:hypothetical protein
MVLFLNSGSDLNGLMWKPSLGGNSILREIKFPDAQSNDKLSVFQRVSTHARRIASKQYQIVSDIK